MEFHHHVPHHPFLAACVDHFWLVDQRTTQHPRQNLFPDGGVTILFNLADPHNLIDRYSGERHIHRNAWIAGERFEPYLIETTGATRVAGIRFQPGGARPFLPIPAAEITGLVLPLGHFFELEAEACQQQLFQSTTHTEVFQHLASFLLAIKRADSSRRNRIVRGALREINSLGPSASVVQLAKHLGTSHRSLLRCFDDWVGLKPKTLQRIVRFQRVIDLEDRTDGIDWCTIAYQTGYYDQAHLIRDFKILSGGLTPTRYRQLRLEYPNYSPEI